MFFKKPVVNIAHEILIKYINIGDVVIDGTLGAGKDAVFLRSLVGANGKLYGFDIQQEAIDASFEELSGFDDIDNVFLIKDSHSNLDLYVDEKEITACVFNLGYLPIEDSDKSIITKPDSTITAIEKAMKLIKPNGIIVITCYYGHEGGQSEKIALEKYLVDVDSRFLVSKLTFFNRKNYPPVIFTIER